MISVAVRVVITEEVEIFFPAGRLNRVEVSADSFRGGADVDIVSRARLKFSVGESVHSEASVR